MVQIFTFKGAEFEVVERPDVLWVGCAEYAVNNSDEPNISAALKRFRDLVEIIPIAGKINPDWSAALSINYSCSDKPCGMMFANEVSSGEQDGRYDLFTQPAGLWLRVRADTKTAGFLLGKESAEPWEFFAGDSAPLQRAARANCFTPNLDIHIQLEYHCHAEYGNSAHTNYAYIPIVKAA